MGYAHDRIVKKELGIFDALVELVVKFKGILDKEHVRVVRRHQNVAVLRVR